LRFVAVCHIRHRLHNYLPVTKARITANIAKLPELMIAPRRAEDRIDTPGLATTHRVNGDHQRTSCRKIVNEVRRVAADIAKLLELLL
jgi:hypothetical protein